MNAVTLHSLAIPLQEGVPPGVARYPHSCFLFIFLQSFWSFVDPLVSDEIKMQLLALRNSESDIKKCRVSYCTGHREVILDNTGTVTFSEKAFHCKIL